MRWNSVEKKKENTAIEAFRLISKYLNEINIFVPDEIEQIRRMDLDSLNHSMVGYLEMLNDINCYIEKYKTFSNMKSLEQLEYELIEERDNCCQLARDFWNTWLSLNHTALRPEDKRNIIEYLNGIKLLQNNQNNESIPKAVKDAFKRVEKTIPKYINAQAVTLLSASGKIPFAPGVFDMFIVAQLSRQKSKLFIMN